MCARVRAETRHPTCPAGGAAWGKPILFSAKDENQPKLKTLVLNPIKTTRKEREGVQGRDSRGDVGETDRQTTDRQTGRLRVGASGNPSLESPGYGVQC